jgi:hypothetical protein
MPTLLELWREQNRDRDGEPSSLLISRETHEALRRMQQNATMERLRTFAQTAPVREMHEAMRLVAERLMGRMRPVSPAQPDKPKPKSGVGAPRSFTPAEIERGIRILRNMGKMSVDAACKTLEEAGIKGKRSAVYSWIWKPAYASQ